MNIYSIIFKDGVSDYSLYRAENLANFMFEQKMQCYYEDKGIDRMFMSPNYKPSFEMPIGFSLKIKTGLQVLFSDLCS